MPPPPVGSHRTTSCREPMQDTLPARPMPFSQVGPDPTLLDAGWGLCRISASGVQAEYLKPRAGRAGAIPWNTPQPLFCLSLRPRFRAKRAVPWAPAPSCVKGEKSAGNEQARGGRGRRDCLCLKKKKKAVHPTHPHSCCKFVFLA